MKFVAAHGQISFAVIGVFFFFVAYATQNIDSERKLEADFDVVLSCETVINEKIMSEAML